jgi:DNA topoisomerase-1
MESTDEEESQEGEGILPPVEKGQVLKNDEITATQRFTAPPFRYSEASLVKKMEELGIGRPSTYAPTISTIQKREYVVKQDKDGFKREFTYIQLKNDQIKETVKSEKAGNEKGRLCPSDLGNLVNKFLMQFFDNIIDFNFTANVEKEFDEVAAGNKVWNEMIAKFYEPFHKQVEDTNSGTQKFSGERLLGVDPATSRNVFVKIGKFGPMVQLGDTESEDKPKFARLPKYKGIETISLDEAMELFKLPRSIGEYEGFEVNIGVGRFGPFIKHNNLFYSLKKGDDPNTINMERAIEVMLEKKTQAENNLIREFPEEPNLRVMNGRFGPYISFNKKNFKIPKSKDAASLELADCLKIVQESEPSKPRSAGGFNRRKQS